MKSMRIGIEAGGECRVRVRWNVRDYILRTWQRFRPKMSPQAFCARAIGSSRGLRDTPARRLEMKPRFTPRGVLRLPKETPASHPMQPHQPIRYLAAAKELLLRLEPMSGLTESGPRSAPEAWVSYSRRGIRVSIAMSPSKSFIQRPRIRGSRKHSCARHGRRS